MEENENVVSANENENEETEKTYTKDEVMELLQKESDRRVSQALNKQKKDYEKKLSLSKLDEDARKDAEKDLRIQELEESLKEFKMLQAKNEVVKVLSARGLNAAFADLVAIGEDAEEAQKKIDQLDKLFKQAVSEEVKRRLAKGVPASGNNENTEITKEEFKKMTLAQQAELYKTNPELYKKLSK